MRKLYVLLLTMTLAIITRAQVSVTATAGTTGPTSYTTLNAAFTAINAGTHQGAITVAITGNTTEPATAVPLLKSGTPSSYTGILIQPSGGNWIVNSAAAPTASRGVIELNGADNVTIDGDDPATTGSQNLTFQVATNTTTGTAAIRLSSTSTSGTDGADNNTVKNCVIIGGRSSATSTTVSYGVVMSNSSAITTGAYSSLNTRIENNTIRRCYRGVQAAGTSTSYLNTGTVIAGNTIGSSVSAENAGLRGIFISYSASTAGSNSALIERNDIRAGDYGTTGFSASVAGIELGDANAGCIIRKNNIHDVYQQIASGYGAFGVYINSSTSNTGITIENNFIRDMVASKYSTGVSSTFENYGIHIATATTGVKINYNTIALLVPNTTGTVVNSTSACIAVTSTTATITELQNNILVNSNSSTQALGITTAATANISGGAVNYNNYYTPNGSVGYYNTALRTNLDAWKAATGKDNNSKEVNPPFASATDLHIPNGSTTQLESGGVAIATTDDYDNQTRPGPTTANGGGTSPDIGADEFDGVPVVVQPCVAPTDQATTLNFGTGTATSQPGSFTAAASAPAGYLIVRSIGALTATPVDGTSYAAGTALGNGTVAQAGANTSFTATGLTGNTTYTFTVFTYNSGSCSGGPLYNQTSPLSGTVTTCPAAPSLTSVANVTANSFTLSYSSSKGGGAQAVTYTIEIATDATFSTIVATFNSTDTTTTQTTMRTDITGLNSSTAYFIRARASNTSCTSANSTSASVNTACGGPQNVPYIENFDAFGLPPCTLVQDKNADNNTWAVYQTAITGFTANVLRYNYNTTNATFGGRDFFWIKGLNLTAGTNYQLGYKFANNSTSFVEKMRVYLSDAQDSIASTIQLADHPSVSGGVIRTNQVIFTPTTTGVYYVGFYAYSAADQFSLYLDSISVVLAPTTPCVAPTDQATALMFGTQATTSQSGSFTAAASAPSGYLVVRSVGALSATPANATTYTAGGTLGNGTVVQSGSGLTFTTSGLTGNTNYTYTVFTFNNTACIGGPVYNTTSPLTASSATCPATPASVTVTNLTSVGFRLNWTSSKGGGALSPLTYSVEVATNSTFTTMISGSPFTVTDTTTGSFTTMRFDIAGLSPTTQYYYRIQASGCNTAYSTAGNTTTTGVPPANDEASGALTLTVGAGCTGAPYTNVNATLSANEVGPSCSQTVVSPVWFKFTAPSSGTIRVSTDAGTGNTLSDSRIALFSATDANNYGTFTQIVCDDDGGNLLSSGFMSVIYATGLTAGNTYYIAVDRYQSSTTTGTFCITADELSSSMLATTASCTAGQTPVGSVSTYTGWVPLLDASSRLIALVRNPAGGSVSSYSSVAHTVNTGAVRSNAGVFYLDRNYLINNTTATNVQVQFFFLNSELAALNAANGTTLGTLAAARQTGTTCRTNFATANGGTTLLPQTGNGTSGDVSWIQVTTPGFSNFYLQASGGSGQVLPANILTFSGSRQGSSNLLKWTVAQESDIQAYEVERSENGRDWTTVGSVASLGNTTAQRSYSFTDNNVVGLKHQYRLRQVERTGAARLSNIVIISSVRAAALTVNGLFPNPVSTKLSVLVDAPAKDNVTIQVMDAVGRTVKTQKTGVESGSNTLSVDVNGLTQGSYVIRVVSETGSQTAIGKFVKE